MRSTYGAPAGSSLEDWPISYDDLEPFYEKAEYEIGDLRRLFGHDPSTVRAGVLCPCRRCRRIASSQSWNRQPNASACIHFTFPWPATACPTTAAAPACAAVGACGFACEVDAKNGSQNTVIPIALNTGNCELRTECMVKEILTDDRGRARGVAYFDADGHLQEQLSDIVVVSACATESARLLLNSKSRLFPNGLGNRYDQVGRNLQGHHYTGAVGYFDFDTYDDVGPGASIAITDYNHGTPGLCGGGMLANEFIRLPIHMVDRLPAEHAALGPRTQAGHARLAQAHHRHHGTHAADSHRRTAASRSIPP